MLKWAKADRKRKDYKMLKPPKECYEDFGADLDGCSRQENEGCGGCRCLVESGKSIARSNVDAEVKPATCGQCNVFPDLGQLLKFLMDKIIEDDFCGEL